MTSLPKLEEMNVYILKRLAKVCNIKSKVYSKLKKAELIELLSHFDPITFEEEYKALTRDPWEDFESDGYDSDTVAKKPKKTKANQPCHAPVMK